MAPQVTFFTGYLKILQLLSNLNGKQNLPLGFLNPNLIGCLSKKPLEPVCGQRGWDAVIGQAKVTLMGLSLEQLYEDRV